MEISSVSGGEHVCVKYVYSYMCCYVCALFTCAHVGHYVYFHICI